MIAFAFFLLLFRVFCRYISFPSKHSITCTFNLIIICFQESWLLWRRLLKSSRTCPPWWQHPKKSHRYLGAKAAVWLIKNRQFWTSRNQKGPVNDVFILSFFRITLRKILIIWHWSCLISFILSSNSIGVKLICTQTVNYLTYIPPIEFRFPPHSKQYIAWPLNDVFILSFFRISLWKIF